MLLLFQLFTAPGCANQVPPVGGPRDSIPPVLMISRPVDSTRNFNGKRIVLEFNEFVTLDRITENLLVSPTPKVNPIVDAKLRTVTINIKDTLEPNTTYVYNFGNAIRDVNEGNVFKNFSYTFSTGNTIDEEEIFGRVILAETGKTDSTLIAVLHRTADDSAVSKERPRYITRLDRDGNFRFRNLPPGTFYLYAFSDPGSRRYQQPSQMFAFADSPVKTTEVPKPQILYAYVEKPEVKRATPSVERPTGLRGAKATEDKRLRFETNLQNGELDLLQQLEFYFKAAPIKTLDSNKVIFTDDKFVPITNYRLLRDTGNSKLTLVYAWKENTAYNLIVAKDFVTDTAGRMLLKDDTLSFMTKKLGAYGEVKLRFINLDLTKNPVLQFIQNDQVMISHSFTNNRFDAKIFLPGDYELRIVFDENKNGKWDPGKFFGTRKQPERVMLVPRKLTVKANWVNEIDITL
ncbi:MAG: Ig-like domain-containing protein [Chitinophagaceae bacterium]|nr:Ig-like domain-containing protein [Chitinophagaceae bacterium]